MKSLKQFFHTIDKVGNKRDPNISLLSLLEEVGELSTALTVEQGNKKRKLKESALEESVDVLICAADLFFSLGGNVSFLVKYGMKKLRKWEKKCK